MAQITASDLQGLPIDEADVELVRDERLRSAVPVAVAVAALLAVLLAGSFAVRTLVDFGAWFLAG